MRKGIRGFLGAAVVVMALAVAAIMCVGAVDWTSYLSGVTGSLPDIVALAAGVVGTVITATLVVKAVKFTAAKVSSALR